ncbi:hypothetical protein PC121_g8974 [Phytophthora cactorum]|nr:hypothetical protein PC120_g15795 [Phytophthora cactorum]KAG3072258.1 hypothetical protein PC121_g8974 [Phytophthora cactorum]KAG4048766.1 hypothetical protein PC123_g15929 [Phytophthora cactorum]
MTQQDKVRPTNTIPFRMAKIRRIHCVIPVRYHGDSVPEPSQFSIVQLMLLAQGNFTNATLKPACVFYQF